ncbi:putative ribonuclease H-like domain-containing protein [Tanacetum coccineum]
MHIDFLEDQPNVVGIGPGWMFDLSFLTNTMNYIPVSVENWVNVDAGTKDYDVVGSSEKDKEPTQEYILLPLHPHGTRISVQDVVHAAQVKPSENDSKDKDVQDSEDVAENEEHKLKEAEQALKDDFERMVAQEMAAKAMDDATRQAFEEEKRNIAFQKRAAQATSIEKLNTGRPSVSTANTTYVSAASTPTSANAGGSSFVYLGGQTPINASTLPNADLPTDPNMPDLKDASDVFSNEGIFSGAYNDEDEGAEVDFNNMDNTIDASLIPTLIIHKDHPKGQILGDPELVVQTRGKIQKASSVQQALILVDLPFGKKAISTKWVFRNKKDERGIVVKNKARLIAQGHRQEEGIDYDEVFAPVARIEVIGLFLACASFMRFLVYQMDVKSAFLYGTIREEVYVHQPPGFVDPAYPNKVYKVVKALYGLHQAPRAWYETLSTFLLENGYRRGQTSCLLSVPVKDFRDSPFELEVFSDSDYGGASIDRKSTTEYVTAASCCGQVLWIQNQMIDYGFNFMNTKIHIDNESIIYVVKNPVYHSRTKHIEIRHHFIRDCYEKRLIDVLKIHIDNNVADLLTKGFDVTRFNFLVVSIGMLNL